MIPLLTEYELLGYLALIFNIIALLQKNTKNTLIFLSISSSIFLMNMIILKLPLFSIYVVSIGLSMTIISLLLFNYQKIKDFLIKISPLFAFIIIFIYGFNYLGIIAGIGFLFATIGKLQKCIFQMKVYLLLSTLVWLTFMIFIGNISFIIFYITGVIVLLYDIIKLIKEK